MTLPLLHKRTHPTPRLVATMLATCLVALGITVSPLATGAAHASDCSYSFSECITISPKNDTTKVLNVAGSGTSNRDRILAYAPQGGSDGPAPNEQWHFAANDDGTFEIVNNNSGKCIDISTTDQMGAPAAYQWDCANSDGQKFYAEPVGDSSSDEYRLRQASSDDCLISDLNSGGTFFGDCTSDDDRVWSVTTTEIDGLRALAATHAIALCGDDPTSCDLDEEGATYGKGNPVCVLDYHNTDDTQAPSQSYALTETVANAQMTGQETTIGKTAGIGINAGYLSFKAELTESWKKTIQSTTTNTSSGSYTYYTAPVEPHTYAWLLATPVVKNYTGNFSFNSNEWNAWTYSTGGTISVSVPTDENGNGTLITTGSGPDSDAASECGGNHSGEFTGSSGSTDAPPGESASTTLPTG